MDSATSTATAGAAAAATVMSVSLHTNVGDIKVELACDRVPRLARVCSSFAQTMS
jgi:hypothetical protein